MAPVRPLLRSGGDEDNFRLYHTPGFWLARPIQVQACAYLALPYQDARSSHVGIPKSNKNKQNST
jgi:hypothetical protein